MVQKASKLCVINILAQVKKALNGDLNKVKIVLKLQVTLILANDFTDQPK